MSATSTHSPVRFKLGQLVITTHCDQTLKAAGVQPEQIQEILFRHQHGDFGLLGPEDTQQQNAALEAEARLGSDHAERMMSVYLLNQVKVWCITEWDRSVTTLLLPEDY